MSRVRTYHVSALRRWLIWFVMGPILAFLLILGISGDAGDRRAFFVTAGLVFLIALPFHFIVGRAQLRLSETGIVLRQTGYELSANWDEIEQLDLTANREGFVTRESMAGKGAARLARFRFAGVGATALYDADRQTLLAQRRLIPIEAFARHLRQGEMREDIERFAPHLAKAFDAI